MKRRFLPLIALSASLLSAGDLAPELQAKLLRVILNGAGAQGKIACKDSALKGALEAVGLGIDGSSRVAWGSNPLEIKTLKTLGKLVICGRQEWLGQGASIALTEEGGRPRISLNKANITASGVPLSDDVLKIASM